MESSNTDCILSKIFTIPIYLWGEDPYAEMQALNLNQTQLYLKGRTQTHIWKIKGKKIAPDAISADLHHIFSLLYFHDEKHSSPHVSCSTSIRFPGFPTYLQ